MEAMVLNAPGTALCLEHRPDPEPGPGEVRLRVEACAVCRTDLHVVDGELPLPRLPIVPGHEIVGIVERIGAGAAGMRLGQRVGVPWLAHTCGQCAYCRLGRENLCDQPLFTEPLRQMRVQFSRSGPLANAARRLAPRMRTV